MPKNEFSMKEIYEVWWEYLKRNNDYRTFCNDARNWKEEHPEMPIQFLYQTAEKPSGDQEFFSFKNFFVGYMEWGDVHETTFEDWWAKKKRAKEGTESTVREMIPERTVFYLGAIIEEEMDQFIRQLQEQNSGKKPSLDEFKKGFADLIKDNYPYLFLGVDLWSYSSEKYDLDDILAHFREILSEARKKMTDAPAYQYLQRWTIPTHPIRLDDIKRYLKVYDLRMQGVKWRDVFRRVYPELNEKLSDESLSIKAYDRLVNRKTSLERSLKRDFSKAEKIIKNVEDGYFPGNYS